MLREVTDLLMPRTCLVCGRQLTPQETHLCVWCSSDLPLTYNWEQAHNPMADELNALLERTRPDAAPMPYVYATALLLYHHENPYKQIPRALKYRGNRRAGRYFGSLLGQYMAKESHLQDIDLVIPVPLHWYRRWKRGYNQAAVLAGEIARELGAELRTDLLTRARHTRTQTSLDADDRMRNVAGVFRAVKVPVGARHILIVDDTFTTGATLAACYNTLREVLDPAQRISVATLSVVQD